jgi:hypothetical protein
MSEKLTIPDLRAEEAELVVTIKKLKKEDSPFDYYNKLYDVRIKLLGMYHQRLPKDIILDNFKSKEEEYDFFAQQHQYFKKYLDTLNGHPVFYESNTLFDMQKIQNDILNVKNSITFIEKQLDLIKLK